MITFAPMATYDLRELAVRHPHLEQVASTASASALAEKMPLTLLSWAADEEFKGRETMNPRSTFE
jgi:hypothetical protein